MTGGLRQALLIAVGGLGWGAVIFLLARRRLLTLRYVLGWLAIALLGIVGSLSTPLMATVAEGLGMTPTGLLLAAATFVLLSITLQLSISVSGLQRRLTLLTQGEALERALPQLRTQLAEQRGTAGAAADDLERTSVLVVIPAWNEAATVRSVVSRVRKAGYPALVVDDGSLDDTRNEAAAGGAAVLRLSANCGVGAALKAGFGAATACGFEWVVQVDADGQHHPAAIDDLLRYARSNGLDMAVGSRFADGGYEARVPPTRRLAMRILAFSASRAAKCPMTDATSGFRAIAQPLLSEFAHNFPNHYLGDTYEALVAAGRGGYRIGEVPVTMSEREAGVSSATSTAALMLTIRSIVVVFGRLQFSISARPLPNASNGRSSLPSDDSTNEG